MVQIVNDPNYGKSGLMQGINSALEGLVSHKVGQMQQKQREQTLSNAFPDIPKGALQFLSQLPPKEQMEALQGLGEQSRAQQEQQQGTMGQAGEPSEEELLKHLPEFLNTPESKQLFTPEEHADLLKQISQQQVQQPEKGLKLSQLGAGKGKNLVEINFKQQQQIDKSNAPFLKTMNEYVTNAESRKKLAQEALDLVESGKVTSGLTGLLPESLLTALDEADSDFVKLTGQLANEKAVELRGPVGKAKLEAAARTKAKLSDPKEAQINALKREIESANKAEAFAKAYEEILEENDNNQPPNFEAKIRARAKQIEKQSSGNETKKSEETVFNELPKASDLPGKRIEFPDGSIRKSNGKEWIKE